MDASLFLKGRGIDGFAGEYFPVMGNIPGKSRGNSGKAPVFRLSKVALDLNNSTRLASRREVLGGK